MVLLPGGLIMQQSISMATNNGTKALSLLYGDVVFVWHVVQVYLYTFRENEGLGEG